MTLSKTATFLAAILLLPQISGSKPAAATETDTTPISDTVQDYTHSIRLDVTGKQGVVGFRLPQAVYLHARSADLSDLRVFDATGAKVAFALQVPPPQAHVQRFSLPVKLFPITSNQSPSATGNAMDLDIKTGPDGTLLSVKTKSANGSNQAARLIGLVLDARQFDAAGKPEKPLIEALHFSLPPTIKSYSAQVWLETSDDLKQWDMVGTAELSWLINNDTQTLANDRLEFEPRHFRYARLSWRNGEAIEFGSITAESITQTAELVAIEKLLLQPQPGKEAADLVYNAAIAIPTEKIGLQFAEPNVVMPATLGRYQERPSLQIGQPATQRFEPLTRATFYQITQAGQTRRSGDLPVPRTHWKQWVLRPQVSSTSKPLLRISWQPANIVFLTSGNGPYTLTFGREKIKSTMLDLTQVAPGFAASELLALEQATAGPLQIQQATTSVPDNDATAAAHKRMWILWGVLLLGVAVLGTLAWSLMKQMKK